MNASLDQQDLDRIAEAVVCRLGDGMKRTSWLTTAEAAEHLRCSPRQVQKMVRQGELKTYRPAGRPLFKIEELDEFIHQTEEV